MNHFTLRRIINKGGMGMVYEADSMLFGGGAYPVAIKVMKGDPRTRERYTALFHREVETNLRISHNHPGLVTVFGQFEHADGSLCMIMELVRGCDLRTLLKDHGPLPVDVILHVAAGMLDALAYIHDHGYLHRDLSPGNVLLSTDGQVKLSDLGLARELPDGSVETSQFRGKPSYASPEQLRKQKLDPRADLYSFAATVYEMATGEPPFGRQLDLSRILAQLQDWQPPPMSSLPPELQTLIGGLFHEDPERRTPQNARKALSLVRDMQTDADNGRTQIAKMVAPLYAQAQARSQRDVPIPLGSISMPVVFDARPERLPDTMIPDGDDTDDATGDDEPDVDLDAVSFSGLEFDEDADESPNGTDAPYNEGAEHTTLTRSPANPRKPWRHKLLTVLAIAAMLVLGFAAHSVFDAITGERDDAAPERQPVTNPSPAPPEPASELATPAEEALASSKSKEVKAPKPTAPVETRRAKAKERPPRRQSIHPSCGALCSTSESTTQPAEYPSDDPATAENGDR